MTEPPTPPTPPPPRVLRRSTDEGLLGGVAAGLARYFGIDPVLVRILLVASLFIGGIGVVAYVVAWILVPDEHDRSALRSGSRFTRSDDLTRLAGIVLIFLAAILVLGHWSSTGDVVLPFLLIGAGTWLLLRRGGETESPRSSVESDLPTDLPDVPRSDEPEGAAYAPTIVAPPPAPPQPPPSTGPPVTRITVALVIIAAGGLGLAATALPDLSVRTGLIVCLSITGAGLLVGAFVGRGRSLIALGVALLAALSLTAAVDVDLRGGVGERRYRPTTIESVEDTYRLGVGEMVIDLRDLRADDLRGETLQIDASISAGSLEIRLPPGVAVTGSARAQVGDLDVFGVTEEGVGPDIQIERDATEGAGTIDIDARVGAGEVVIR